jgi:hypothetical protein
VANFELDDDWDDGFGFDMSPLLNLSPEGEEMVRKMVDGMRTPLAPGDPRRHHYVPKFYLRRFAADDQIVRVRFDKPRLRDTLHVNDVAVMRDLYTTIDVDVGETVAVERILAVVDGAASSAIARLALGVLFPPQRADQLALALWLSMLHVRGPSARRWMEAMADHTMKMQMSLVHDEASARAHLRGDDGTEPDDETVKALLETVESMDEWEITPHQNEMVQQMLDLGLKATPFFLGRRWAVVKFPENGLVLTDKPVVLYKKPENRSPFMGVGLASADEIWLPLDRSTALILHTDEVIGDRVFPAPAGVTVDTFNQMVVGQAYQEVYCHPDDVARLKRITLPKSNRPLMQASGTDWVKGKTDGVNEPLNRTGHRRYRRPDRG